MSRAQPRPSQEQQPSAHLRQIPRRVEIALGVGLVASLAVLFSWGMLFGTGEVILLPSAAAVELSINGAAPQNVAAGTLHRVRLPRGRHKVQLSRHGRSTEHLVRLKSAIDF